jgi:hypothetical protein
VWSADGAGPRPEHPETAAALIAATWLAAARVLVLSQRPALLANDPGTARAPLETLLGDVLDRLEQGLGTLHDLGTLQGLPTTVTGWPVDAVRAR